MEQKFKNAEDHYKHLHLYLTHSDAEKTRSEETKTYKLASWRALTSFCV
jgi:hypothetical protein